MSITHLIYVAIGGALGAISRALISHYIKGGFPWATFIVNVSGSLLIGLVLGWMGTRSQVPHGVKFLFATGFCGAFTTFSTFSFETLTLFKEQSWEAGLANIALNVILCILAVWIGIRLAIQFSTP
ncbi:MAG: fluoride efflux transporter CrcB [Verrucomicrobiota bacterium]